MAKKVEQQTTAPQELKELLMIAPGINIPPTIKALYENTKNCLIIGDSIKDIDIDEIKSELKKQNKIAGPNTLVSLEAHGSRVTNTDMGVTAHFITLKKGEDTPTIKFIEDVSTINGDAPGPECFKLYSCYGSTATNEFALQYLSKRLKNKLILITYAEAKHSSSTYLMEYMYVDSIRDYREKHLTPYQQFIYDLPQNYETANFVVFEGDGDVQKFKTTRIARPEVVEIIIKTLESMPQDETRMVRLVRSFLREDARRFMYQFENVVDRATYNSMHKAVQDIEKINDQMIKNFVTGKLLHFIYVSSSQNNTLEIDKRKGNIQELIIKLLPNLKKGGQI